MSALSVSQEELLSLVREHIARVAPADYVRMRTASEARARAELLTFEEAADILRLKGKNRRKAFHEYAANHRIKVVHDGKRSFVRVETLLKHELEHEMFLAPRQPTGRIESAEPAKEAA